MVSTKAIWSGAVAGLAAMGLVAFSLPFGTSAADGAERSLPTPLQDASPKGAGLQTAVFAGGCFWGVQGVFEHVAGVTQAVSGYAGGHTTSPGYEQVSGGATGHAEAVRVTYDPAKVSYGRLLQIFFSVALDPTQVNRQGPDFGTQYRSALFVRDAEQDRVAQAYLGQLTASHVFSRPIATEVTKGATFYPAEAYHQDYLVRHPTASYIAMNDMPKVEALKALFPQAWRDRPVMVGTASPPS